MELAELQSLWTKQDETMKENVRLNREILRQLLLKKPEKRIQWIKIHSFFELLFPLIILPIFISDLKLRDDFTFYLGAMLFGSLCLMSFWWAIRYFRLVSKIDFSNSIIILKKQVAELEKNRLKTKKIGFLLSPIMLVGMFMLIGIKIQTITFYTMTPLILIVIVFITSIYVTFKYSIFERFRKLKHEINELEKLGSE